MPLARFALCWVRNAVAAFFVLYPLGLTILQWMVWSRLPFSNLLLTLPLERIVPLPFFLSPFRAFFEQPGGYFAFYAWGRFWFPCMLVLFGFCICILALALARRYTARPSPAGALLVQLGVLIVLGIAVLY